MSIFFSLIVILFSAIIHEYMHGWMADYLGDPTAKNEGRLTLNPINHIDLWGSIILPAMLYFTTAGSFMFGYAKPVPFNPYNLRDQKYGAAKVAIAGPLANLITAIFFGIILRFILSYGDSMGLNSNLVILFATIVQINLMLMVFNLLPIPPLDGSKVIAPFLPRAWEEGMMKLEQYGMILVLFFVMFGFQIIVPVISFLFRVIVGV